MDVYELLTKMAGEEVELIWVPGTKTIIVAVISEKGGVGKTGLTTGLAAVAALHGLRVLVVDLDPRGTATKELGVVDPEWTVNDLLFVDPDDDDPVDITGAAIDAILDSSSAWPDSVQLLAAKRSLARRESDLTPNMEKRLKLALQGVAKNYDLVVMDVPPRAGGKLTATAFEAAQLGIIPATLDEDGYDGANDALITLRKLRAYNPEFQVAGIVRNIVDRRKAGLVKLHDKKLFTEFGDLVLPDTAIASYVVRKEARTACVPFTNSEGPDATLIRRGYTGVLNTLYRKAA